MAARQFIFVGFIGLLVVALTSGQSCEPCETEQQCVELLELPGKEMCFTYRRKCPEFKCKEYIEDSCGCCEICAKRLGDECEETSECGTGLVCRYHKYISRCMPENLDVKDYGGEESEDGRPSLKDVLYRKYGKPGQLDGTETDENEEPSFKNFFGRKEEELGSIDETGSDDPEEEEVY